MTGVYCIVFNMERPSYSQDRTPAKHSYLLKLHLELTPMRFKPLVRRCHLGLP